MAKYPNIKVKLVGQNGNAFNLLGLVSRAMKKNKVAPDEVTAFMKEAMSGDYDHLLDTCVKWVEVS